MQVRLRSTLTSEEYVATRAWHRASLEVCPVHGRGCRSLGRHGTYSRYTPFGPAQIVRYYCPPAHETFSLLPDCFAAGLTGTLAELEAAVDAVESEPSLQAAARTVRPRPAMSLAANRHWLKRRHALVVACLTSVISLLPVLLAGCVPSLAALRIHLGVAAPLVALRGHADASLQHLPRPLGFRDVPPAVPENRRQHTMGPDPPSRDRRQGSPDRRDGGRVR